MTHLAVHTSTGLHFTDGGPSFGQNSSKFGGSDGKVKCFALSPDGSKLAWISNGEVNVVSTATWEKLGCPKHPRGQEVCFSPKGNYLAVWESFVKTKDQSQMQPNLSVYDVNGKKLLRSFFQQSQVNWQPQWTADESLMARHTTGEVHFYQAHDLAQMDAKMTLAKLKSFSLSPSTNTHYVCVFMPSVQSYPAYVRMYRYPEVKESSNALANKSFFKVDTVENYWNKQCNACLLFTSAEMDKSGNSYYGEHMLFYLSVRGDAARVSLSKAGNIHSVAWCPNGREFFVVYGTMPACVTLFNQKCDAVAEFGTGARNTVLVNPVGNIAMIGGFGNIAARFEMWDIAKRSKIGDTECPDTTHMSWSPCGQYLVTATCSPRLRVNNGYKVWHYTAVLQHQSTAEECYAAQYLPDAAAAKPFTVTNKPVQGIQSSIATASKQKYIPPSQRGRVGMGPVGAPPSTEKKFLSQMDEPAKEEPSQPSKSSQKNKKRKEAARKKKEEEEAKRGHWRDNQVDIDKEPLPAKAGGDEEQQPMDPEKKIKRIKKKLDAIAKLKDEQEGGKKLGADQITKIGTEEKLRKELEELSLLVQDA